ncbi:MAG: hypothetical protein SWC96_01600, partial [Thermodesulfobacteriota bacterium]|nr:hypothetical protein [Thermodesulfobacteriota bacterium]
IANTSRSPRSSRICRKSSRRLPPPLSIRIRGKTCSLARYPGKQYTAPFPEGINRPVQYGINVKVHSVYMSQYQLVPYKRIEEDFQDQAKIPISAGTVFNFNYDAYHVYPMICGVVITPMKKEGWRPWKKLGCCLTRFAKTGSSLCKAASRAWPAGLFQ